MSPREEEEAEAEPWRRRRRRRRRSPGGGGGVLVGGREGEPTWKVSIQQRWAGCPIPPIT